MAPMAPPPESPDEVADGEAAEGGDAVPMLPSGVTWRVMSGLAPSFMVMVSTGFDAALVFGE